MNSRTSLQLVTDEATAFIGSAQRALRAPWQRWPVLATCLGSLLLSACVSYGGGGLKPGIATLDEVRLAMGAPTAQWQLPDGRTRLSYPRGPMGLHSFMVELDANGRLQSIENVLTVDAFARIRPGMSGDEVSRIIGPPVPEWTQVYPARGELAWEWRYCNNRSNISRFHVLLDEESRQVRSTMSIDETCPEGGCLCGN